MKYVYLSAHDSTMMEFLSGTEWFKSECLINFVVNYNQKRDDPILLDGDIAAICPKTPNPAASLMFELVQKANNDLVVRVSYDGEYIRYCPDVTEERGGKMFDCEYNEF